MTLPTWFMLLSSWKIYFWQCIVKCVESFHWFRPTGLIQSYSLYVRVCVVVCVVVRHRVHIFVGLSLALRLHDQFQASAIYQLCQSMPGTAKGHAGTSRDKAGTNRVKRGQTGTFPFCPCLSLLVPVRHSKCLSHHNQRLCNFFLNGVNLVLQTYSDLS